MNIHQAIMNLYEIDVQIREAITALSDYAVEKPFGLPSSLIDEEEITKARQDINNGYPSLTSYFCKVLFGTLNEWEQDFVEWLDLTEFTIGHDNAGYFLYDLQGANLGDINQDRFGNAAQILDRMGIYIEDYLNTPLCENADELDIDISDVHYLEDWLKYRDQMTDSEWDFRMVDMICNHAKDIDLSKVVIYLSAR